MGFIEFDYICKEPPKPQRPATAQTGCVKMDSGNHPQRVHLELELEQFMSNMDLVLKGRLFNEFAKLVKNEHKKVPGKKSD